MSRGGLLSLLRRGKFAARLRRVLVKGRCWQALGVFLLLALTACDSVPWVSRGSLVTPTNAPMEITTEQGSPALPTLPEPAVSTVQAEVLTPTPLPLPAVAHYDIDAQVDYEARSVTVEQHIRAVNPAAGALSELVLAVEASRQPDVFTLDALTWEDGSAVTDARQETGAIRILLAAPIQPGGTIELRLRYTLRLKPMYSFLGFTGRQLNLGDWYPFLPAYQDGAGWLLHDPTTVGEHLVYPTIDYDVVVHLSPYESPLVVAGSAIPVIEDNTFTFQLSGARGFALSISPDFQILSTTAAGAEIRAYVFAENMDAGKASAEAMRDAVTLFSEMYASYPYASLSLVEADFFDGMEYSGMFFLGAEYFNAYPGAPTSYLVPLSAHETAHQWWYSLVGNDPAREPWLDEAFCTHSEVLFYEKYHPDLVDWWWNYRIWRFLPSGKPSADITTYSEFRPYVDAVYLQGTKFLDAARREMGDEAFLAFFRDYAAHYTGRIATTTGALELLQSHSTKDLSALVQEYFDLP